MEPAVSPLGGPGWEPRPGEDHQAYMARVMAKLSEAMAGQHQNPSRQRRCSGVTLYRQMGNDYARMPMYV